jgi:alanine racemase
MNHASRQACREIDLNVIHRNASAIQQFIGQALLCAVVKGDAYGHGAVEVARAALDGGAARLGVAFVEEAIELRTAGISAPILVFAEPPVGAFDDVIALGLTPTLSTAEGIEAAAQAASRAGTVHSFDLCVDTGMNVVGFQLEELETILVRIRQLSSLHVWGLSTRLAVANKAGHPFTDEQINRFTFAIDVARNNGIAPDVVHCANSAATLMRPDLHMDMVRCGAALYGISCAKVPPELHLRQALTVKTRVSHVRQVAKGEAVSYGRKFEAERTTTIAILPIGYADGIPPELFSRGATVLVNGTRVPIAGTVAMDQIAIDCTDVPVQKDDEVVLLGKQQNDFISAVEWEHGFDIPGGAVPVRLNSRLSRQYVRS